MLFNGYIFIRRFIYILLGLVDRVLLQQENPVFILSYHSIHNDDWRFSIDIEVFKKQIDYLVKQYDFITLKDLHVYTQGRRTITKPSVVLTFDDGYQDVLHVKDFLA